MIRNALLLFFLLIIHSGLAQHSIAYIANEGILIESGGKKIMIDAIFDNFYKNYTAPSEQTIQRMNARESPYQSIDCLLITHAHLDHFNPEMVYAFMSLHNETALIAPNQAIDSLTKVSDNFKSFNPRINGIEPIPTWQSLNKKGIEVNTAFVRHGGKRNYKIYNQIYLINVNNRSILHIGDAEMETSHFENLELPQKSIDVALIPYWFLAYSPGVEIIRNQFKPKKLIAIHYPKVGDPKSLEKIRENFPNAVLFMNEGQRVAF